MARYAIVNEDNIVINIIEADADNASNSYISCPDCGIGQKYVNGAFVSVANPPADFVNTQSSLTYELSGERKVGICGLSHINSDESILRNTIKKMERDDVSSRKYLMVGGVWKDISLVELKTAYEKLQDGLLEALDDWYEATQANQENQEEEAAEEDAEE